MLSRIVLLTKLELCNIFGFNQIRHSKDKKEKSKSRGVFAAYLIIYIVFGIYAVMFAFSLRAMGLPQEIPTLFSLITMMMILITNLFKAGNTLFNLKNYEKLAPLPVKPVEIVIARFLNLYILSFITDEIFFLPAMLISGTGMISSPLFYINGIIAMLLMPFIPLTISILFGTFVMLITSKMEHKNIFQTVFAVIFSVLAIVFSFFSSTFSQSISEAAESQEFVNQIVSACEGIRGYFLPSSFVYEACVNGNMLSMLFYVLISVVPFVLVALFAGWKFIPLCQKLNQTKKGKAQKVTYEGNGRHQVFKAMVKKELKGLISCPAYFTNSLIGYVMLFVGSILLTVMMNVKGGFANIPSSVSTLLGKLIAIGFAFFAIISCASVSSISIEGKRWWIYKSLPLSQKDIIDSKLFVNYILSLPVSIISSLIVSLGVGFASWTDYVLVFLVPIAAILYDGVTGMKLNMKYPKFEWNNESEVVKQSKAVTYLMLIGLGITFILALPMIILSALSISEETAAIADFSLISGIYGIVFSLILIFISFIKYKKLYHFDLLSIG